MIFKNVNMKYMNKHDGLQSTNERIFLVKVKLYLSYELLRMMPLSLLQIVRCRHSINVLCLFKTYFRNCLE